MRTYICTVAALYALRRIPGRNLNGNVSLLTEGYVLRNGSIKNTILHETGNRHIITFESIDSLQVVVKVFIACLFKQSIRILQISPLRLNCYFYETGLTCIDRITVVLDDIFTLTSICMTGAVLHQFNSCGIRHDLLIQSEESRLQDRVGMTAHVCLNSKLRCVDDVELSMFLSETCKHSRRQITFNFISTECCVQQECSAFLQVADHIKLEAVAVKRAGNKVSLVDIIRAVDRALTKSQMRTGNTACLLGVICKVSLCIKISIITNDLNCALVGTDCTVGTQTVEQAGTVIGNNVNINRFKGQMCNIIVNTDRELFFRFFLGKFSIDTGDVARVCILTGQTVTAADQCQILMLAQSILNIEEQRLSGTDFLGTIQNSDLLSCLRQNCLEILGAERTIQIDLDQTDLLTLGIQRINCLHDRICNGTHGDDDTVSIRSTVVYKRSIVTSCMLADCLEVLGSDIRNLLKMFILCFTSLEEDIIILGAASCDCVSMRIQCLGAECFNLVHREQGLQEVIVHDFNFLNFVRCTETVKEVHYCNGTVNGDQVCSTCEVHTVLNGMRAHHDHTCLTACVDILVVTEDTQCVACKCTCSNMDNTGEKLTTELVKVRDHQ